MQKTVWALLTHRTGDNAQVLALAERLALLHDAGVLQHQVRFNRFHLLPNVALGASTLSLASDMPQKPWPDFVVAAGKRTVPLARWIRQQSGGTTRLIHIGRPRAALALFDLVVTTPQYGLPDAANVLKLPLPLTVPQTLSVEDEAAWQKRWQGFAKPVTALLLGGGRLPLVMGQGEWAKLAKQTQALMQDKGGTLLVITSPRTKPDAAKALANGLGAQAQLFAWGEYKSAPYRAALAWAERFVVTGDSASMLADAAATGRPVLVFPLPSATGFGAVERVLGLVGAPPRNMAALIEAGRSGQHPSGLVPFAARQDLTALDQRLAAL